MIIRVIGFDLDQTLYPKSPAIDEAIQRSIYKIIAHYKKITEEEARLLFYQHYPAISGRKTLLLLGIPHPEKIIQEALEHADIEQFLIPDQRVSFLLSDLKSSFGHLALITGSSKELTLRKLAKLKISPSLFDCIISGETSKSDGTAYKQWIASVLKKHPHYLPEHFLYIGDRPSTDVEIPLSLGMQSILVNVKKPDPSIPVPQLRTLFDLRELLLK